MMWTCPIIKPLHRILLSITPLTCCLFCLSSDCLVGFRSCCRSFLPDPRWSCLVSSCLLSVLFLPVWPLCCWAWFDPAGDDIIIIIWTYLFIMLHNDSADMIVRFKIIRKKMHKESKPKFITWVGWRRWLVIMIWLLFVIALSLSWTRSWFVVILLRTPSVISLSAVKLTLISYRMKQYIQ